MQEEKLDQAEALEDGGAVGEAGDSIEKVEPIETERTKGHILDVGPGTLAIDLPSGYIDKDGKLHTFAVVREMRGHEEDILASTGSAIGRLSTIITNCIIRLGDIDDRREIARAAAQMTAYDRMAIFIAIRRVSLGDFYDCVVTCPKCNVEQHKSLDLKEIEIVPMPDRMKRVRTDALASGKEIRWHILQTADEEWLTSQKKKKDDRLTLGLLARVEAVGEVEISRGQSYREAVRVLKDLSIRDRTELRHLFEREEGFIDTNVEFDCEECQHVWEGQMEVGQSNFFFPSGR